MIGPPVDLSQLAYERTPTAASRSPKRRRGWLARYVVPAAIGFGFLGLIAWAMRESLIPATPVTVVPVVVTRSEVQQSGTPLFQAAGWIEPRPTAVHAAALTEGVVADLLVVEGESVVKGQPLARLIDTDAKLAVRQAEANRNLAAADLAAAEAEQIAAKQSLDHPVELDAQLADAQSKLAALETTLGQLPYLTSQTRSRAVYARQNATNKESAGVAVARNLLLEAQSLAAAAEAELAELEQRGPRLEREVAALTARVEALTTQRRLLIEHKARLSNAEASLAAASARLAQADLAVERAKLDLARTEIVSPIDGRVMALVARPGSRVMGITPNAELTSSTVVTLYDPASLQVRADVRLEDVPFVQPGQPAQIETASASESIRGTVLLATSAANVQKNTLEVKVALIDPPENVRPDMLVAVTFLAPDLPGGGEDEESERLLAPRDLVETGAGGSAVWVVDGDGLARRRTVTLGRGGTETLVEVADGLTPTDKLIASGTESLSDGQRVRIADTKAGGSRLAKS